MKQDLLKQDLLKIRTLGELRAAGVEVLPVRLEMRRNLLNRLRARERILPGIIGYDQSVLPEIENGVLAGHHMIFLGERGQAKSRLIRLLADLLDERVAAVKGCEINDDPFRPICGACRRRAAEFGEELEIEWIGRERRYAEKLATPDVSVADLIGEIDPIKVAEGRYLADAETIHYGLIPRTNRGIFAINELPDLTEKVQVGLFNLMEEKDVQIKGYKIRLPVDVVFVASANPEDYTSRGRIITPLKDRFDIQIRTHYPKTLEHEVAIMEQECSYPLRSEMPLRVPQFLKDILAQITFEARASNEINQTSGVSVRVTINNLESLISNAEKRTIITPAQIIRELPSQISLPAPITLQTAPALPNSPTPKANAVIPAEDLKPLYDFTIDCKTCQAKLGATQGDLADERQKTAALTRERDDALRIARGGSAWRRIGRAAKWFLIGAAAGAIAAKTAH